MLLCQSNFFLQLLEGEKKDIHILLDKIKKDSRHDEVTVIYEELAEQRLFPDWSMAYKDMNDCNMKFIKDMTPYFSLSKSLESPEDLLKLLHNFSESFGHKDAS